MLKGHPKGLYVAFFANMGERFGFYTMMAILVLFLQAKFGLDATKAGTIYSTFYFAIYGLALLGGIVADATKRLLSTITIGLVIMFVGYLLMATPGFGLTVSLIALAIIAFGNGLFKGNLQALVGNLYEYPQFAALRDRAFMIFYMGINIGAFFAPSAATGVRNWWLKMHGFGYNANLPQLSHAYLNGTLSADKLEEFRRLAEEVSGHAVADLATFAKAYIDVFSRGFHMAFGVAAISIVISLLIYTVFIKYLKPGDLLRKKTNEVPETMQDISPKETKDRLVALGLVFLVVIFFWMAFHQNGLTLTFFARDYIVEYVSKWSYIFFDLKSFLLVILAIISFIYMLRKDTSKVWRGIWAVILLVSLAGVYWIVNNLYDNQMHIEPEKFQHFNPIFIVFLTPVIVWFFGKLNEKGKEPSTPRKIAIGMFLASLAYIVLIIPSLNLPAPKVIGEAGSPERISEYWLISTYLTLTIAELFLSPMGISFVSKVAPPKLKGSMQGAWLGATAIGNWLLRVGSYFWVRLELWQVWAIFVVVTSLSGLFMVIILKKLERITGES